MPGRSGALTDDPGRDRGRAPREGIPCAAAVAWVLEVVRFPRAAARFRGRSPLRAQAGRRERRTVVIMGGPWEHEFDNGRRSAACVHDDCPHKIGSVGGFNPRRVRLEFGAELCRCGCHSSCPVASERRMAVPVRAWREKCTCPGAEDERVREDRIRAETRITSGNTGRRSPRSGSGLLA